MAAQGLVSDLGATAAQPRGLARLRLGERWRNLEASLQNGDRQNDVNWLEAMRQVGERAGRMGEELGAAAVKLMEEAGGELAVASGGLPEGDPSAVGLGPAAMASAAAPARRPEDSPAPTMGRDQFLEPPPQLPPDTRESLWEECEQLQARLAEEREMRRGRLLAFNSLDEAIRGMSSEVVEERRLLAEAEEARTVWSSRLDSVDVTLEELQDEHGRLQSHQASLEPELRRLIDAAAARARAERQASREGAWAREGPETEALKVAKMELAEVLSAHDQAKLRARQEQAQLKREIEAAQDENDLLRKRREEDARPKGLRGAVVRLLKTARRADMEPGGFGSSSEAPLA